MSVPQIPQFPSIGVRSCVQDLSNPNSLILASNKGHELEITNFPLPDGQISSSSIRSLSSLIVEIEANVEQTWEMTEEDETGGTVELDDGALGGGD